MTNDLNRKVSSDEFECVRAAIWECAMTNCRYALFDLGGILLRNDPDGTRRKQWKGEVSTWFYTAINRELQEVFDPDTTFEGLRLMILNFWNEVSYWMPRLGEAALDAAQVSYFKTRLNHILYEHQKDMATYLLNVSIRTDSTPDERQPFVCANVHLQGLHWDNPCASEGYYMFKVEPGTKLAYPVESAYAIK